MTRAPQAVFLVGFMGAGKSRVGQELAQLAGRLFVDLDAHVERAAGETVEAIFAHSGEAAFRAAELRELEALDTSVGPVVACGGGLFAARAARLRIARCGSSVWLDVPLDVARGRVAESPADGVSRPLWHATDPVALRALYERRRAVYALADLRVAVGRRDAAEVAREVLERLEAQKR